jgi:Skp family chaperone for outer membrane proteins
MIKIRFAAFGAVMAAGLLTAAGSLTASAQQATQAGVAGLVQDGKVAVINTQLFPARIAELKQKYDQVEALYKDRFQKLQSMDAQAKELDEKLQTQRQTLAPDKVQEMQAQLDEMKKRGSRELEDFKADYNKSMADQTKPIQAKLAQFVQNYASQHGIILILDLPGAYQTGTLAYWSPGTDITEDFIGEYNKANPVPGAAAQPAAKPAAAKP